MRATYDLNVVKRLVMQEHYWITRTAQDTASQMKFGRLDIVQCVTEELNETHFYKTMEAEKAPGLWQDVYRIVFRGRRVYLKLQTDARKQAVVISFKEDTSFY